MTSSQLLGRCWTSSTQRWPATCSAAPTWPTTRPCSPTAAGGSASAFTSKVCEWLLVFNLKKGLIRLITNNYKKGKKCCFSPPIIYVHIHTNQDSHNLFFVIIFLFRKAVEVWDPLPESERFGNTLHLPGTVLYNIFKSHPTSVFWIRISFHADPDPGSQ